MNVRHSWLRVVAVGMLAGELLAHASDRPLVPLAVASGLLGAVRLGTGSPAVAWRGLAFTLAAAVGAWRFDGVRRPVLAPGHVARLRLPVRIVLEGEVAEAPERTPRRTSLIVDARAVDGAPASGRVRVGVRGAGPPLRPGDRVRLPTTLRRPRNFANLGGSDGVGRLARRSVYVTGFVWDPTTIERLPRQRRSLRGRIEQWRARVSRAISRAVAMPERGVLQALVVGDTRRLSPRLRDAFARAGVVHVLSVSGLHVGMVGFTATIALRWLLLRSETLALTIDVQRLAAILGLLPVLVYAALAGLGVATLRSALMVAAGVAAITMGRSIDVLDSLALAALAVVLGWPGSSQDVSFQLSFASVLVLVLAARTGPGIARGWVGRARAALRLSTWAAVGTAPLTAFHFHQVSLVGPLTNPVVIPLFGSAVVALGLAGAAIEPLAPSAAAHLFRLAGMALRPGVAFVRAVGTWSWAAVDVPMPSVGELAGLYALLGGGWRRRHPIGRALIVAAALGLLLDAGWWVHERYGRDRLRVTFLDVGQGDAAVVELPNGRVLVVDAGGLPGSEFDTGAAIVSPFLWSRKIRRVDALVMTHAHPDHFGGLAYLVVHHRPREFWWNGVPGSGRGWRALAGTLARSDTVQRILAARDAVPGGVVLHPPSGWEARSLNDGSLTLRLEIGDTRLLLTGDIEAAAERLLLRDPSALRSSVVKVPHHGSATSSTPAWLGAVAPQIAVISVGAENRYHLPAPTIEARYRAAVPCVLRTDRCGAITVDAGARDTCVSTVRAGCGCPPP